MSTKIKLPNFHPMVWILLIGSGLIRIASSMCAPFLTIFLTTQMHLGILEAGLSLTAAALASMLSGFIVGNISDRFGRKRIILGSILLSSFLMMLFAVASRFSPSGLVTVIFSTINFLFNLARRSYDPVAQACIAELTPQEMKTQAFSWRYWLINVGSALGPAIGVFLGFSGGNLSFVVASLVYFLLFLVMLRTFWKQSLPSAMEGSKRVRMVDALKLIRTDSNMVMYIAAISFFMVGYSQVESGLAFILRQLGDGQKDIFAFLLTLNGLIIVFAQIPISAYLQKKNIFWGMTWGSILMSIGIFLWGIAGTNWSIYIFGMVICTLGEICVFPLSGVWIDSLAPVDYRATWFGAAGFSQIGASVAPLIAGFLLEMSSPAFSMSIIAMIVLFALPLFRFSYLKMNSKVSIAPSYTS